MLSTRSSADWCVCVCVCVQSEGVRVRLTEVEGKLGEEVKGREAAEELCEQLQKQLRIAQEDCLSLQQTSLALREQVRPLYTTPHALSLSPGVLTAG